MHVRVNEGVHLLFQTELRVGLKGVELVVQGRVRVQAVKEALAAGMNEPPPRAAELFLYAVRQAAQVIELRGGKFTARPQILRAVRGSGDAGVPVALDHAGGVFLRPLQHFARAGAFADQVSEHPDFAETAPLQVGVNGLCCREVRVQVGQNG